MFLTNWVDDSRPAMARYRRALQDAFDTKSFAMFYSDHLGSSLADDVDVGGGFAALLHQTLENCRRHGEKLRRLLVGALRCCAARVELVEVLAPPLGLGPVIEVADLLEQCDCPPTVREQALLAREGARGARRVQLHREGRAAWIDILVWLEELPDGAMRRPPLLDYLELVEHAWSETNKLGAAALGRWLAKHREARSIEPRAFGSAMPQIRGALLEFDDSQSAWILTAYLFGDEPPTLLFHKTFAAPGTAQELCDAVRIAVNLCLADRAVVPLLAAGADLRFEIVLPNRWVWAPVDHVPIAANEQDDVLPTRLGASHPVVVRPRSWWRPRPGSASHGTVLRRFKNKRDHLRHGNAGEIRTLDCPSCWTPEELELINESPNVVGIALACDRSTTENPEKLVRCLRAHVLAIVWKRSGVANDDAVARAYLGTLLMPIEEAPRIVREHRLLRRAELSLIWHVEAVEPPERIPFEPPEIDRELLRSDRDG